MWWPWRKSKSREAELEVQVAELQSVIRQLSARLSEYETNTAHGGPYRQAPVLTQEAYEQAFFAASENEALRDPGDLTESRSRIRSEFESEVESESERTERHDESPLTATVRNTQFGRFCERITECDECSRLVPRWFTVPIPKASRGAVSRLYSGEEDEPRLQEEGWVRWCLLCTDIATAPPREGETASAYLARVKG